MEETPTTDEVRAPTGVELMEVVLAWLRRHPTLHRQKFWGKRGRAWRPILDRLTVPYDGEVCGTRGCVAGWALVIHGYRPPDAAVAEQTGSFPWWSEDATKFIAPDGRRVRPYETARDLMELSESEAQRIFSAYNSRRLTLNLLEDAIVQRRRAQTAADR